MRLTNVNRNFFGALSVTVKIYVANSFAFVMTNNSFIPLLFAFIISSEAPFPKIRQTAYINTYQVMFQ